MARQIMAMREDRRVAALDLVEAVFTAHENAQDGKLVRRLVEEIRSKRFYLPELELMMVKELVPGGLDGIRGQVSYRDYETLQ